MRTVGGYHIGLTAAITGAGGINYTGAADSNSCISGRNPSTTKGNRSHYRNVQARDLGREMMLRSAAITILALYARADAVAQTCQDVLKAKPTPTAYQALYNLVTEGLERAADAERVSARLASLNSVIKEKTGYNFIVVSHPVYSFMVKYDTDARRMTVGGYLGLIPLRDGTYLDDKRVKYTERDDQTFTTETGNYVGSNAFGVTKVITKKVIHSYALGLGTENVLSHGWPHNDYSYSFTMAPDVALQTKDHLEVILVGKPTIPFGFNLMEHFEPTLSNPSDVTKYIYGSTIDVRCAVLLNGADGKIIQNIK